MKDWRQVATLGKGSLSYTRRYAEVINSCGRPTDHEDWLNLSFVTFIYARLFFGISSCSI